jgi:hypothetical protein
MREHQIIAVQMFFFAELGMLPFSIYRYTCAGREVLLSYIKPRCMIGSVSSLSYNNVRSNDTAVQSYQQK